MKRLLLCCLLLSLVGMSGAQAAERGGVKGSVGYSFLYGSEDGFSLTFPLGGYAAVSATSASGFGGELRLSYHHHWKSDSTIAVNELLATAGPRFEFSTAGTSVPFLHLLAGVERSSSERDSNSAFALMGGGGVDLKAGSSVGLRLEADYRFLRVGGVTNNAVLVNIGVVFGGKK